jgi:type I restriction enzyme S subunit
MSPIATVVLPVSTWNPPVQAPDEDITYIDLSSVENEHKAIVDSRSVRGEEAPSRARQIVKSGDIIVSTVRPNLNGVAQVPEELDGATASTGFCVLRPDGNRVDARYLFHWTRSPQFISEMVRRATGASYPAVSDKIVLESRLPLPPLPEQRRIAAILDAADALRQKRRQALRLLDQLTQAIFVEMFGDPVVNSKDWENGALLGEHAEIVSGVTKGRKLNGKATREIPYLAVYNVQDRALRLDQVKTIEATEDEIARYRLQKDDLLLTEGGDPDKLGRGTLWDDELPECIHQNHIFRVRLRSRDLDAVFLNWLIGSERGKRYFLRSAKQTTGIASINMGQLRSFPLLMPPVELQREFRDRLEQVRAIKDRAAQHANELDGLFASLQHRAFRGEL